MEQVILVDQDDNELGTMEKLEAHQKGCLHRAFSILIFNSKGEMLLQKRSKEKYHSGGLWTNACCSHPLPNESMQQATRRRLFEELDIELTPTYSHKFTYKIQLENNLIEHEMDYVFVGTFDGEPKVNSKEVEDWKYISLPELMNDVKTNPDHYTYWFRLILKHPELKSVII